MHTQELAPHCFSIGDAQVTRSSPQLSTLVTMAFQQPSAHASDCFAPIRSSGSITRRDGLSARLESVETLAYQGVNCKSHSKDNVVTKTFFATTFVVWHEIIASRTALVGVNDYGIADQTAPNQQGTSKRKELTFINGCFSTTRVQSCDQLLTQSL